MKQLNKKYYDASIIKWLIENDDFQIEYKCISRDTGTLIFHNCSNADEIIEMLEKGIRYKCKTYRPEIIGFGSRKHNVVELDCDIGLLAIHCTSISET